MLKKWLGGLLLVFFVIIVISLILLKVTARPILEDVSFSTVIYDANGRLLRITLADDGIYRIYKPLNEISKTLQDVTLMYEDKWFYYHFGVNPYSMLRAVKSFLSSSGRPLGASTITMQTARLKYKINSKSLSGKMKQILYSLLLEIRYSKKEILEAYLNLVPYGYNIEGAGAASTVYFDIEPLNLTLFESFSLVVIPQNPNKRVPVTDAGMAKSIESRKILFKNWVKYHPEDISYNERINMPLFIRSPAKLPFLAPHFTDYMLLNGYKGVVHSTLNLKYQWLIEEEIKNYISDNRHKGIKNSAALLLNYKTMEVIAYAGSSDYFNNEIEGQVNGIISYRSPGSVLKPFIFGLGIEQGLIHPKSMMKDAPRQFGSYSPENADRGFMGPLFARDALVHSRNIPAISLLTSLEKSSFYNLLYNSGIKNLKSEQYYGTALAIGGFEVTMEDVAKLYAGLGNSGVEKCINYSKDTKCSGEDYRMFSSEAAFLTIDMLYYNPKPSSVFDNDYIAWKTGTSYGYRDAWSSGIFGDYVLVVWSGNFDNAGNNHLMGRTSAGELFFNIILAMKYLEETTYPKFIPDKVLNIREVDICSPTGDLPNDFCVEREKGYFIPGVSPIKVTDVFRQIPIDNETGLRACDNTLSNSHMEVYEFWPSDILQLFRQSGIRKKTPPRFMPDCKINLTSSMGTPPYIITPSADSTYNIYSSNVKEIGIKVATDADADTVHYFINKKYLGSAKAGTNFFWYPVLGSHTLTVTDNIGRSSSVKFSVKLLPER